MAVCVAGSMNETSRTYASSEPPKNYTNSIRRCTTNPITRAQTHSDDPAWCFLLATQYPFCPDDAGLGVYRAVDDIDAEDVAAVGIRVLVPHSNDDVLPRMSAGCEEGGGEHTSPFSITRTGITHS